MSFALHGWKIIPWLQVNEVKELKKQLSTKDKVRIDPIRSLSCPGGLTPPNFIQLLVEEKGKVEDANSALQYANVSSDRGNYL